MPTHWLLENLAQRPVRGEKHKQWVPKRGRYQIVLHLDGDEDGRYEFSRQAATYVLRFSDTRSQGGVVSLRLVPVSSMLERRTLSSLVQAFAEEATGSGVDFVWTGNSASASRDAKYSSKIVQQGAARVAGQEAFEAALDVANLDQLRVDPAHRFRRLHVVLARTPFRYDVSQSKPRDPSQAKTLPVMLLATHANAPEAYAGTAAEFADLLNRIQIKGVKGYSNSASPVASAAPVASAPVAPAASSPVPPASSAPVPPAASASVSAPNTAAAPAPSTPR
jgi:hypothetical protein